jgi:hypothetical protein
LLRRCAPSNRAPIGRHSKLRNAQHDPDKANDLVGGNSIDAFAFEFMGLMMIALCLAVLAIPSGRRPSKHVRHY